MAKENDEDNVFLEDVRGFSIEEKTSKNQEVSLDEMRPFQGMGVIGIMDEIS